MIKRILLLLILLPAMAMATQPNIVAFSLSTMPFVNVPAGAKVYYLDVSDKIKQSINRDLAQLNNISTQQIKARYRKDFVLMSQAIFGKYQAKILGITKLPAVVFNKRQVIYGELNISKTLAQYYQHNEEQNG